MQHAGGTVRALVAVVSFALAAVAATAVAAVAQEGPYPGIDGQAPGEVGPHDWTVEPFTIDVTTGPDDGYELTVDADLYRPTDATPQAPAPAMLVTHGFGGTKDNAESVTLATYFASHGYVVISWSSFGFGGSAGCIALDSIDWDAKTAIAMMDHLAGLDYVALDAPGDPKVGMIGGSYGGGSQLLVAASDDRIDALAPGRTWNTLQYSLVPNNWIADAAAPWDLDNYEQGVFKQEWTTLFFGLGQSQPAMGNGGCDPITQQTLFPGQPPCSGFLPPVCEIYARLTSTGDATEEGRSFVERAAGGAFVDQITAPTMFAQGMPDTLFTPTETTATFLALRERGVPVAMIWHDGGHGGYAGAPGEGEPYDGKFGAEQDEADADFAASYWARRHLQWMERYVRGRDVDTGPAFAWFRDWVDYDIAATGGTAAPAYYGSDTFPVTAPTTYALDAAGGALVADPADVEDGSTSFVNPPGGEPAAYSETSNFTGDAGEFSDVPPSEQPGQFVTFTSAPFEAPHDLVGVPTATLHLSHADPVTDVVFFAKLYDVGPDGTETLVRRLVAPARIPTSELGEAVRIRLVGTAHRFDTGHALRVVLSATDQAYYNAKAPDQITVTSSADAPSTVTVPLIAEAAVPQPEPIEPAPLPDEDEGEGLPATGGGLALSGLALLALAGVRDRRR